MSTARLGTIDDPTRLCGRARISITPAHFELGADSVRNEGWIDNTALALSASCSRQPEPLAKATQHRFINRRLHLARMPFGADD
jgi:hypothetical protein